MPETRTVKGFSEGGLPLAEGDFELCDFKLKKSVQILYVENELYR